jgi:hypothetical protein
VLGVSDDNPQGRSLGYVVEVNGVSVASGVVSPQHPVRIDVAVGGASTVAIGGSVNNDTGGSSPACSGDVLAIGDAAVP